MQAFYHQQYCDLEFRPSAVTVGKATVGALTIRTGFWGCMYIYIYISCYSCNKEPQNRIGNYLGRYIAYGSLNDKSTQDP